MRTPAPAVLTPLLVLVLAAACGAGDEGADTLPDGDANAAPTAATALGNGDDALTPAEIEAGRMDGSWRASADRDAQARRAAATDGPGGGSALDEPASASSTGASGGQDSGSARDTTEAWEDISPATLRGEPALPLAGDVAGPSVAMVQIALDRALFSPGIIDGRWGKNTEKAVYWLQERYGLEGSGTVTPATWDTIRELGGMGDLVTEHTLTQEDVSGPFVDIPADIYAKAELECMCYESREEQLAERFHASRELLAQLNPGKDLGTVAAGETLVVPSVRENRTPSRGAVARIVVSDGGHYVHGVDAQGQVVYHFPSTLGSEYAPSPGGTWEITAIAPDPTWHYQPDLLTGEPDGAAAAIIPAGPNNPVGVVWMQLSKEHYGIHGTAAPATIGYATSHGCVRLTNWDADFLRRQVAEGTTVEFVS